MDPGVRAEVEILVHTSAPSGGKDDAKYRAYAAAYLDFTPNNAWSLFPARALAERDHEGADEVGESQTSLENHGGRKYGGVSQYGLSGEEDNSYVESVSHGCPPPERRVTRSSLKSALQRSSLSQQAPSQSDSPQLSFNSVMDNMDSPAFRQALKQIPGFRITPPHGSLAAAEQSSWKTPPSVVGDSQSTVDRTFAEFSSPTRVLRLYLQSTSATGSRLIGPREKAVLEARETGVERAPDGYLSISSDPNSSVGVEEQESASLPLAASSALPSLPLTSQVLPEARPVSATLPKATTSSSEPSRIIETPSRSAEVTLQNQQTEAAQKSKHTQQPPLSQAIKIVPSSSIAATIPDSSLALPPSKKPKRAPSPDPLTIHPPVPKTSCIPPDTTLASTLITAPLLKIAQDLKLPSRYRPLTSARELRPDERGYWSINPADWGAEVRGRAWNFLRKWVESGQAGWGIWCVRDRNSAGLGQGNEREDGGASSTGKGGASAEGGDEMEWRVYCWGATVGHVWLLLYMVSERKLKERGGARWIDGEGKTVVQMP